MRSLRLLALGLAAVAAASCGDKLAGTLPVGPTALEQSPSAAASFAPLGESRVAPLVIADGISCPSDAPVVVVGTVGIRIDIEWSAIPRVHGYQVQIEGLQENGAWTLVHQAETTSVREEWRGLRGITYRVRVRSLVCEGFGQWSGFESLTIDREPEVKAPQPPVVIPPETCQPNGPIETSAPCAPAPCGFASVDGCVPTCDSFAVRGTRGGSPCDVPPAPCGVTPFQAACECENGVGQRGVRGNENPSPCNEPGCETRGVRGQDQSSPCVPDCSARGVRGSDDKSPCAPGCDALTAARGVQGNPCAPPCEGGFDGNGQSGPCAPACQPGKERGPRGVPECELQPAALRSTR